MKDSTQFEWLLEEWEQFHLIGQLFNVSAAKKILSKKPHPLRAIDLGADITKWVSRPQKDKVSLGISINWNKIDNDPEGFDLNSPIIIVQYKGMTFPIDGWHRIALAIEKGLTELPAFLLSKAESKKINM